MTTYAQIASKQDREFQTKAKRLLGPYKYNELCRVASSEFQRGLREEKSEIKRINTARRLVNSTYRQGLCFYDIANHKAIDSNIAPTTIHPIPILCTIETPTPNDIAPKSKKAHATSKFSYFLIITP